MSHLAHKALMLLSFRMVLKIVSLFLATAQVWGQTAPKVNIVHPLPPQSPPWVEGFQARWPVRVLGDPTIQTAQTVVVCLPTGGLLKTDASDLVVQTGSGKLLSVAVLSHDPAGDTIIQFKKNGDDPWYWVYGVNPKGSPVAKLEPKTDPVLREGVTLELRDWAGDDLGSWVKVRAGLEKSANVIGNAIVTDVFQNTNPARPDQPFKFAASYRGHFQIKKDGPYSFVVNADDAAFLFIDGFKVFDRAGNNRPLGTVKVKELEKIAGKVDLKAGVHSFEVHQACGNGPDVRGACALVWTTPDAPKFALMPSTVMVHPLYGRAAAMERPADAPSGAFVWGLDDTVETTGLKLFLVRFEAEGRFKEPGKLIWNFGDGVVGTGQSITHIYFTEGDYQVTLDAGHGLAPFRRKIHVWAEPGDTSPLSLDLTIKTLSTMDWKKLDQPRIQEIFAFLALCEQPSRWPLLESVAQHLLAQKNIDLEVRSQYITARMESLTQMGKAAEAVKLAEQARPDFAKTPALQVRIQLGLAAIHQYHYRDAAAASKIYKSILDEHSRTEHPNLRLAGIRWGDLFAEAGDLTKAAETYRIAATLGGDKFAGTALTEATTRGALMRIAEQKLKAGDIHATRQLLEKIELEYPGRRLDGLYCFLRAESDRFAGRYEESLRYYETLLKLPQWAGYRDRASLGIADCFFRMGELDKALKWLGTIKEAFPKFYEAQKVNETEKLIENRVERIKAATEKGKFGDAFFKGFRTGFEPDEADWFGMANDFVFVRSPGMNGPHAALMDVYPRELVAFEYNRVIENLTPGASYWVEIWYRDILKPTPAAAHQYPFLHVHLVGETPPKTDVVASATIYRNANHQWHKLGFKLKAPTAQDCNLKITFNNLNGAMLFDDLSIRLVTDRQLDSLNSFLEGPKTP